MAKTPSDPAVADKAPQPDRPKKRRKELAKPSLPEAEPANAKPLKKPRKQPLRSAEGRLLKNRFSQTNSSKATQTGDHVLIVKEDQLFQSLRDEKKANGLNGGDFSDVFLLDIPVPQMTLGDMLAYAEKNGCEIRIS